MFRETLNRKLCSKVGDWIDDSLDSLYSTASLLARRGRRNCCGRSPCQSDFKADGPHDHGHADWSVSSAKLRGKKKEESSREERRPIALAIFSFGAQAFSMAGKGPSMPILLREGSRRRVQRGIDASILAMTTGLRMRMEAGRGGGAVKKAPLSDGFRPQTLKPARQKPRPTKKSPS